MKNSLNAILLALFRMKSITENELHLVTVNKDFRDRASQLIHEYRPSKEVLLGNQLSPHTFRPGDIRAELINFICNQLGSTLPKTHERLVFDQEDLDRITRKVNFWDMKASRDEEQNYRKYMEQSNDRTTY